MLTWPSSHDPLKETICGDHIQFRDGNGPGRRVKRQSRGPVRPSKSHTHPVRPISKGLKILARPTCEPSFYDPVKSVQIRSAV
jgi:hypothetical protein